MRILLDTNVLVSAALFPRGITARAFEVSLSSGNSMVVPRYALDELLNVCQRKFPKRLQAVKEFVAALIKSVEIVDAGSGITGDELAIRDSKDWPIWWAAKTVGADILLTGDKDFLESGLTDPRVMSPAHFLELFDRNVSS